MSKHLYRIQEAISIIIICDSIKWTSPLISFQTGYRSTKLLPKTLPKLIVAHKLVCIVLKLTEFQIKLRSEWTSNVHPKRLSKFSNPGWLLRLLLRNRRTRIDTPILRIHRVQSQNLRSQWIPLPLPKDLPSTAKCMKDKSVLKKLIYNKC